jgi:hypothetical protein
LITLIALYTITGCTDNTDIYIKKSKHRAAQCVVMQRAEQGVKLAGNSKF